jgi:hypothetical protein
VCVIVAGCNYPATLASSNISTTSTTTTTTTVQPVLETVPVSTTTTLAPKPYKPYDAEWLATLKKPKDSYWDKVAQCETRQNWQNKGQWAGGLGIYVRTWKNFGGHEFANHPSKATREEQIIIANRIALYGWQTQSYLTYEDKINDKPFFRNPVGFYGWGCIAQNPNLKPPVPSPRQALRNR